MWFKTVLSSKTFPQTDYYLSQYYIYIIADSVSSLKHKHAAGQGGNYAEEKALHF